MLDDQDRQYHLARVRAELDAAYRAERHEAAEAHLKLSALHMERLRQPSESV